VSKDASIAGIAPAAARRRGFSGGAARSGGKFQRGSFSRSSRPMPRAGAEAQILVPRIGQTGPRPKKIAAPRRLQRLLEDRFRDPALHIDGLYSVRPIWRACWRCSNEQCNVYV
jgi:hypothetical protein